MFNNTPAQKLNWLLGVKQMVFTLKKKLKSNNYEYINNSQGYKHSVKSCAKILYHWYIVSMVTYIFITTATIKKIKN